MSHKIGSQGVIRLRTILALVICLSVLSTTGSRVRAGGYPPFGAWAYGSGFPGYGVARTRTVYRSHPFGWHGAYSSVRTTSYYRPVHHIHRYHYKPWVHHYRVYPRVVYRPLHYSYAVSPFYYYPVRYYTWPVVTYPVTPAYVVPGCVTTPSISVSYPLAVKPALKNGDSANTLLVGTSTATTDGNRPATANGEVPTKLLNAADTILRAGGFKEAAAAYARLSMRYGSSHFLLERRFVAHVLARDFDQAEVIVSLIDVSGARMTGSSLHSAGIKGFLESPVLIGTATEALAARALTRQDDAIALQSVATWLEMTGDQQRSTLFHVAAEQLQDSPATSPLLPANEPSEIELVSFE